MANLQECFDDFDAVCHSLRTMNCSLRISASYTPSVQNAAVDAKAFELCADLDSHTLLFVEYVILTRTPTNNRKMRGPKSYGADCFSSQRGLAH